MRETRFGPQPAKAMLQQTGRSFRTLAVDLEVRPAALLGALNGHFPPAPEVRERLATFLGRPVEELFTPESLTTERYAGRGRRHRL